MLAVTLFVLLQNKAKEFAKQSHEYFQLHCRYVLLTSRLYDAVIMSPMSFLSPIGLLLQSWLSPLLWVANVPCKCLFSAALFIWSCRFMAIQSLGSSSLHYVMFLWCSDHVTMQPDCYYSYLHASSFFMVHPSSALSSLSIHFWHWYLTLKHFDCQQFFVFVSPTASFVFNVAYFGCLSTIY